MTPNAVAAARTTAVEPRAVPRASLREVAPARRAAPVSRWARLRRKFSPVTIAVSLVLVSLLAVVVGNMELAGGQLRLSQLQAEVGQYESAQAATAAHDAWLASPAVVAHGIANTDLRSPSETFQIPGVSVGHPLPPPTFSSAPCCSLTPGR
jgi:hypothetical protein